ncbi:MAG: FkbM family methyltransferase [Crocinitomicaceae bacterium]
MKSVLEAGAHKGTDTVKIAEKWPNAKIYAFEPVPDIFQELKSATSDINNVQCEHLALGAQEGTITMHVSSGRSDGSSSILKPKEHVDFHPDVSFEHEIEVPLMSLDKWAAENHVDSIDFMWLDMQGAEYEMLNASSNILNKVKVLFTEVSLIETYEGVPLYNEFRAFLESKGFEVYKEYLYWEDMGNVLFVRRDT